MAFLSSYSQTTNPPQTNWSVPQSHQGIMNRILLGIQITATQLEIGGVAPFWNLEPREHLTIGWPQIGLHLSCVLIYCFMCEINLRIPEGLRWLFMVS